MAPASLNCRDKPLESVKGYETMQTVKVYTSEVSAAMRGELVIFAACSHRVKGFFKGSLAILATEGCLEKEERRKGPGSVPQIREVGGSQPAQLRPGPPHCRL